MVYICGFHKAILYINTHRLLCLGMREFENTRTLFSLIIFVLVCPLKCFSCACLWDFFYFPHKYYDKSRLLKLDWLLGADGSQRLDNRHVTHRTDRLCVRSVSHCWWRCKHSDAVLRSPANRGFALCMWTNAIDAFHVHSFICNHINKRHTRTARRRCNGKEKCNPPFILW